MRVFFVARPGFEPRQTAPKTVVLPLHHQAIPMPFFEWSAKIGVSTKFSKFLSFFSPLLSFCANLSCDLYFKT